MAYPCLLVLIGTLQSCQPTVPRNTKTDNVVRKNLKAKLPRNLDEKAFLTPQVFGRTQGIGGNLAFSPKNQLLAVSSGHVASKGKSEGDALVQLWNLKTKQLLRTLKVPTENATALAFSPDGKMLATSVEGTEIFLWDVKSGKMLRELRKKEEDPTADMENHVRSLYFSPDGKILASGNDFDLRLWNPRTGTLKRSISILATMLVGFCRMAKH